MVSRKRKHQPNEDGSDSLDLNEIEGSGDDLFASDYQKDYIPIPELDEYDYNDKDFFASSTETQNSINNNEAEEDDDNEIPNELNHNNPYDDLITDTSLPSSLDTFLFDFLTKHYTKSIKEMCTSNHESLYVSYTLLGSSYPSLIPSLLNTPSNFMHSFNQSLSRIVYSIFPNYKYIRSNVFIRILNVPSTLTIRSLRNIHLNTLIKIDGVVTRRSSVYPFIVMSHFCCLKCTSMFSLMSLNSNIIVCFNCQSRGPHKLIPNMTVYKDVQRITIQEIPGTVSCGMLPRQKEIILSNDLINTTKPGEIVSITGIYKNLANINMKSLKTTNKPNLINTPTFQTNIECITIEKQKNFNNHLISSNDVKEIIKLSKNPNILNILINSFAPSICGHEEIKKSLLLSLLGGERKEKDGHVIRGDINILLLGDPGTSKSMFLRYIQSISQKSVLASGQGSSSVGLTASVKRDQNTNQWVLEGGALVLADKGTCLIDEFDKMEDKDRVSIHEAMEQQTISVSKAGIVSTLNARCCVIAAANPKKGRYNNNLTFAQNVNLSDPIISRFDVLCVLRDIIGFKDEEMAEFIVKSHQENVHNEDEENFNINYSNNDDKKNKENMCKNKEITEISQEMLMKYISYAKNNIHPQINEIDTKKISKIYSEIRQESKISNNNIPITPRQIESIIRISEAHAKLKLKQTVQKEDIDTGIKIVLKNFIDTQKYCYRKNYQKKFAKYIGQENSALLYVLNNMFVEKEIVLQNSNKKITVKEYENRIRRAGLSVKKEFYGSEGFRSSGYVVENGYILKI